MKAANKSSKGRRIGDILRNRLFQKVMITIVTVLTAVLLIENGAVPKKYKLGSGEKSQYDITAPRDIENKILTEKMAEDAAAKVPPVMTRLESVPIDVINNANDFINEIKNVRMSIDKSLQEQGITKRSENYQQVLELERSIAASSLKARLARFSVPLSDEQVKYLVTNASETELDKFTQVTIGLISTVMKQDVDQGNLPSRIDYLQSTYQSSELVQEFKNIGSLLAKALMKPNSVIDQEMTDSRKLQAYNTAMENRQMIREGSRILSFGDIVTEDKLEVLGELNLLETGKFDFPFSGGILAVILMLSFLLILYIHHFCIKLMHGTKENILLSVIILMTLLSAWLLNPVQPLLIPVFIAPMLISILLDLRLAVLVNLLLSMGISFITKGNLTFFFAAVIGGTVAAFIVYGANQRSRLSASGLVVALINAVVVASFGLVNKDSPTAIANNAFLVGVNGMLSTIFTIGTLPLFESIFNVITPLKLLELVNPNQTLMKKLLMEAPGTYHHSLMVGNLAEAATEAINGNALLARVGAYYHDVGKLKRPNFFKENQLSDNPHDRMTPNLSTLVITSHTNDGAEIAEKYKVPIAVRNIISQHHGTTLAAFFYFKAKKTDKTDSVKQEDFRYPGPRPTTKEAAVVMLADSVEAAIRSMIEKTEGKMEGMVRKIIKDKLDDGQLDLCDLTLRDLDMIAKAFMRVFGGYFHEREEYPEMKIKKTQDENKQEAGLPETSAGGNMQEGTLNTGEAQEEEIREYEKA
ncbi:MAG TPA: HDIG domain-containing protein [Clostridia bacterium]|nr:HDIG domain-containing protein [Clostridia bacterium]